jgi:hypothetical protein
VMTTCDNIIYDMHNHLPVPVPVTSSYLEPHDMPLVSHSQTLTPCEGKSLAVRD